MRCIGTYEYAVDGKGRVCAPAEFRAETGDNFYAQISEGAYTCVNCMAEGQLAEEFAKFNATYGDKIGFDMAEAYFYSNCYSCKFDAQGRINLSSEIRKRAGIESSVVLMGCGSTFRILSPENYEKLKEGMLTAKKETDSAYHSNLANRRAELASSSEAPTNPADATRRNSSDGQFMQAMLRMLTSGMNGGEGR